MLSNIGTAVFSALLFGRRSSIQAFTTRAPLVARTAHSSNVYSYATTTAAFMPSSSYSSTSMRMSQWDDDDTDDTLSFDDAGKALLDEDEAARAERSGNVVTEEQTLEFEAKKTEYETMRDKIRDRATDLNIEKSVTTRKAIEDANRRATNREESPEVDLSKIGFGSIGADPEDELSDEEMALIDKTSQMSVFGQATEEFNAAKWPGLGETVRQTGFMLVIFVFTAGYILFLDETVRNLYTNFGLIPSPDQVFDYSDLELPEGWTDMMNENDLKAQ